jgi:alkylation response protein AidB-like acyl-CoA dehydrogenase
MTLTHQDVRDELRQLVRRFLADTTSSPQLRAQLDGHPESTTWSRLAELGITGLTVPEAYDGEDAGPAELGVVLEELGRSLFPGPYFSTAVLATRALTGSNDEAAKRHWLPRIATGQVTATLAVAGPDGRWSLDATATRAVHDGTTWRLSGSPSFVIDGDTADLLLVIARHDGGVGLFTVQKPSDATRPDPTQPDPTSRTRLETLDLTRSLARIDLIGAPATEVAIKDLDAWFAHVRDHAAVALAAEQLGGADRCLAMAVEYAQVREQFGRPIGSFQAIKHTCAQLLVQIESARSAVRYAESVLGPVGQAGSESAIAATVARTTSSEAFTRAAKANLQIHGGIGFTWEHDAHLFLRRAKSSELLLGSPLEGRRQLADLIGL